MMPENNKPVRFNESAEDHLVAYETWVSHTLFYSTLATAVLYLAARIVW